MSSTLIIDNWLLQDIGGCLAQGLSAESSSELIIDRGAGSHSIKEVSFAGVQVEALLGLLVDIVLRDALIVDSDFTGTWEHRAHLFAPLLSQDLIRALPFRIHAERLREPTKLIVGKLCVTTSLREAQKRNEESWKLRKIEDDKYMSAVIWGSAGMLSRSHVFEAPYSGHPLRWRLLEQSIMTLDREDMVRKTNEWITSERLRLYEVSGVDTLQRQALLVLPPIAVEVINEARGIDDLISVAVQLREKYRKLREWLKTVQNAVDTEDAKKISKYKKTLNAVAKDINRAVSADSGYGKISLKIGYEIPSVNVTLLNLQGMLGRFGTRAILSQQVFAERGEKSLKKLLKMFDEEITSVGLAVRDYIRAPHL
ncbi:MAG: hypothetical protein ACYC1T_03445 [Sulfuricaulis sp.]